MYSANTTALLKWSHSKSAKDARCYISAYWISTKHPILCFPQSTVNRLKYLHSKWEDHVVGFCMDCFCVCYRLPLTCQSVLVEPDWADPGWWAECGYLSRQLSGIWATSWRTWWQVCSHASADDAATEPCEIWTHSHLRGPEQQGSPRLLRHWPPLAVQTPRCCPRPRWWGTGRQECGPGRGERARRWQWGSQRCQSRRRGGGQGWWSGTAVRSKGNRHRKSEGMERENTCADSSFMMFYLL